MNKLKSKDSNTVDIGLPRGINYHQFKPIMKSDSVTYFFGVDLAKSGTDKTVTQKPIKKKKKKTNKIKYIKGSHT